MLHSNEHDLDGLEVALEDAIDAIDDGAVHEYTVTESAADEEYVERVLAVRYTPSDE